MPRGPGRSATIEVRIDPEALAIVERAAAALRGRSVGHFVVAAAREAAHRAIEEAHLIRLSAEDRRRFVELLPNPPGPSPALRRARKAHDHLIRESR